MISTGAVEKQGVLLPMDLPWEPVVEGLAKRGIRVSGGVSTE
jgi:hypothetical protein